MPKFTMMENMKRSIYSKNTHPEYSNRAFFKIEIISKSII